MIARLKGRLEAKSAGIVIVMAGGVGYEVNIPLSTFYDLPDIGQDVVLNIKTIVREESIELFGFLSSAEKEAFTILNSVSKVGPRLALAILSGINPVELADAVVQRNIGRLHAIPGIGPKTAERLVVELKDKVARLAAAGRTRPATEAPRLDDVGADAVSALINLGYQRLEAERAVSKAQSAGSGDVLDLAALLRLSLKNLQKA